ncbi:LOW QUALITY PROTEIN: hypothetical protein BFAG_01881, partial [Bacteroides fragilis 3_1_12]
KARTKIVRAFSKEIEYSRLPSGMATHKGCTAPSLYQLYNIYNKTVFYLLCSVFIHLLTIYFHIYSLSGYSLIRCNRIILQSLTYIKNKQFKTAFLSYVNSIVIFLPYICNVFKV